MTKLISNLGYWPGRVARVPRVWQLQAIGRAASPLLLPGHPIPSMQDGVLEVGSVARPNYPER